MKFMKKYGKVAIALVLSLILATTAWATASYRADLDDAEICVTELSGGSKTVKLTAKVAEVLTMDGFTAQVKLPEGWKINAIANSALSFNTNNYNLANGMIAWYSDNAENVKNDLLAEVTIGIPAGTEAGEYEIEFEIIDISRDFGIPWETGMTLTAALTVGEHTDGADDDHLCDYGCGKIADEGCHDADKDGDHACDECGKENVTTCADNAADGNHKCDECGAENVTACGDSNKDHVCDTDSKCAVYTTGDYAHADSDDDTDHLCEYCGVAAEDCSDASDDDDHDCDECGETLSECTDADNDNHCDECGAEIKPEDPTDPTDPEETDPTDPTDPEETDPTECTDDAADGDHKCDDCGAENVTECVDSNKDHVCDTDSKCAVYTTGDYAHADGDDKDHLCDYGCGKVADEGCHDEADDGDHDCDECGAPDVTDCSDTTDDVDHDCDDCGETLSECADADGDGYCDECGEEVEPVGPVNPFVDVIEGKFYYEPVLWAVENGITNGIDDTHFAPLDGCSRAHVVTFLWRAAGSPEPRSEVNPFTDVVEGKFYYTAVLWAVEEGITKGVSNTEFAPNQTCTRGQIVTFLWRYAGEPKAEGTGDAFTDLREGAFYMDAVAWAVENGVTNGMGNGKFAPNETCTRGQVVTFLQRAVG